MAKSQEGVRLFIPKQGGSNDVFFQRPLSEAIMEYCVQDITLLPKLPKTYSAKLTPAMTIKVRTERLNRIRTSQGVTYEDRASPMRVGRHLWG